MLEKQGMNKSTSPNRFQHWVITALASLYLMQFQHVTHAGYDIQVGSFKDLARSTEIARKLERQAPPAAGNTSDTGAGTITHIRLGSYPGQTTAENVHKRLDAMNISDLLSTTPTSDITRESTLLLLAEASSDEAATENTGLQDWSGEPASIEDLFGTTPDEGLTSRDETTADKYNIRGFFNSKYAYTYPSPGHSSMFRNTLELQASDRFNNDISWKISARGSYDAVFDLNDFYSERVEDNRRLDGALHETYLDISRGDWDFRIGRQHIIWGEMVGLFFADVVSAQDTRQFVAEDFDLIRIPQWALRAEHFKGDFHSEAIWIPYMTYDEIGEPGDDFYPLGTDLGPPAGIDELVIRNDNHPAQKLSNGAYGLRLSMLKRGWDISGFYYSSMDATPSFFSQLETGPTTRLTITPEHDRIHQLGATLAKDFGIILLRSEVVYTRDRWYIVDNPLDPDGVTQQNTLDYVVGLERSFTNGASLNLQLFQSWYTDYDSDILFDELETGVSLYASKELFNKVDAELLLITSLNRTDWMARPKVTWEMSDNWWLAVGVDIFGGNRDTLFGRFDDSDRVYGQARYTF